MEENNEKLSGTVQYWLEVHRIGSILFQNIKNGDNSLKSLTTSVIESPLLSDIECLSNDEIINDVVSPFTSWLLEGFLKASTYHTFSHFKSFYIVSQSKLLTSCYGRSLYAFQNLATGYLNFLEKIIQIKTFPSKFTFLLQKDYNLTSHNKVLSSTEYVVNNFSEQLDFIITAVEVIKNLIDLIIHHCPEMHPLLWRILIMLFSSNNQGVNCLVLPLLCKMLHYSESKYIQDENMIKSIFKYMFNLIVNSSVMDNPIYQQNIFELWKGIKEKHSVVKICNKDFVRDILKNGLIYNKNCNIIKNFLISELSFLLSEILEDENVLNFLEEFPDISFIDKINLSFDCISCEIEDYIRNKNFFQENNFNKADNGDSIKLNAAEISINWKKILSFQNVLLVSDDPSTSKLRLDSISYLVKFCWEIFQKLDMKLKLCKFKIEIIFFGDILCDLIDKLLSDLQLISLQQEKVLQLTVETLAGLLNLPESQNLSAEKYEKHLDFLVPPLASDKFHVPGFGNLPLNSNVPMLFLKCLQTVPLLKSVDSCLTIFSKCSAMGEYNKSLTMQAVKSVPFLFLCQKISPSRLISEVLLPVASQENKELLGVLIDTLPNFTCALAGSGFIKREKNYELSIYCKECFSHDSAEESQNDLVALEPHLIELICQMPLQDAFTKKKLLKIVPRLAVHLNLANNEIMKKLLSFLSDPDEEVRHLFSRVIESLLFGKKAMEREKRNSEENEEESCISKKRRNQKENSISENSDASNLFFETMEKLVYLSLNSRENTFLQGTLLETLVTVFRVPDTNLLGKNIKLLLLFIGQPSVFLPAIILEITAAHKTTPLLLYYSHRPEISHFLGNFLAVNYIQYKQQLRPLVAEIVSVFKGLTESRFANGSENYIIPILVLWSVKYQECADLLKEWASLADQSLLSIITKCFQFIYTYTFLNETTEIFEKCLAFIENITSLKFSELMLHSQKLIIYQLLFSFHKNPEKVLNALRNALGLPSDQGKQKVVESLESRFVGYLLFIVSKFVKEINADSEKVQAIHSLTSVIELMGRKYVTPIARKVLATLQTTLSFDREEYLPIQLNAWTVFVQTVNPEDLGPLLATILITLLPFLKSLPVATSRIFRYLIVKNEEAVKDFLPSLIFIPDHPLLTPVISKLQKYISFEGESLKDKLIREISIALHETVGVRVEGLKALQKTIKNYHSEIQNLIIGSDEPDSCIKILLDGLVTCCSDCDENISSLAASCLGRLGAIDPGLLPREPKPKNTLPLSVHDPEFAYLALTEICRGFQNARNSVDMDAFAIAIQEILKMYQISPTSENRIWHRFPQQIQNLMTPMLSSWFKVQAPQRDIWPEVVFGSQKINTHIGWASLWASKLIGYCKDDRSVFLFKACEPSLKRDTKVLLFFLQYILLQAVIRDVTVHDGVIKEMETVINYSPQNFGQDDLRIKARPIRLIDYCGYPNMRSTITESEAKNCAMTIFLLIDFLHSWLRIYRSTNCTANGDHLQKRDYVIVKDFLDKVDYLKLSVLNYDIGEYPRAIMYLEDVILKTGNLSEHLPLLSKAYALYGDLDSVAGSSTFQKASPKIEDLLLSHQVSGQREEIRIIYEKLGKDGILSPAHSQEMVQCYLNLGEPYTALNCINSFTKNQPDLMSLLSEGMAESLIKLGDYSQLDKFLKESKYPHQDDWFVQVGHLLLNVRKGEKENFLQGILNSRLKLANSLKQVGLLQSDYQPGYFCLVKLQILNEIERVFDVINNCPGEIDNVKEMVEEWNSMFSIVQSDHGSLESLLSMRRVLLNILKGKLSKEHENFLDVEIAKNWVKSAEIARKAGCFHQSYNYILNAEQCNIPLTFIEKAQLYWDKNDQDLCLFTLSRGIKEFFPNAAEMKNWPAGERLEERKMCAEAKLLYAVYSEETSNCDHNTNMTNYQSAFEVCRQLEKTETFLGQCLDRVVQHIDNNEQEQRKVCELKILMVHHFGKSLMYGCEYIYQTVPRMLSIWLDLGEKIDTEEKSQALLKINKIIQGFVDSLPAFVFMTALPQLISRLGHPNRKVFLLLKNILGQLLLAFPQQCLWAVQAVAKSSVAERVQRYNEFIQDSAASSPELIKLIADFTNLCDKLNKLTNRVLSQETAFRGLKVSSIVKELPQLLSSEKFSSIIIPITRFCSICLPRNVMSSSHEPFPRQAVYITGIEEEVTVLQSLQRPRKISFRGSDGKLYDILCKPKDDLRRDGRLMEFNNIVNMYLRRDPESRLRRLHIRTYVVTPLGESGGLLEWVPNLIGLRQILMKLYKQFGKYVKTKEVKRNECLVRDSLEKKRTIFVEKLLVLHPPIFPEWFRLTFPDPSGWYIARESYVRTTAVMSMVGYILGLGDRHGENILFDSESGDTVHVDFNCLFNKGEKFDWKERVPFRLTHNMVAAMGPFGVEGTFRKSCEITLRVLRSQTKTLMSVLTPFAYDPFGSWGKNKEIVQNERDQKIGEAYGELSDIEQRLNGSLRVRQKQSSMYLSVEGQVRSLIIEATDIDNLCQMYFGWGAYL